TANIPCAAERVAFWTDHGTPLRRAPPAIVFRLRASPAREEGCNAGARPRARGRARPRAPRRGQHRHPRADGGPDRVLGLPRPDGCGGECGRGPGAPLFAAHRAGGHRATGHRRLRSGPACARGLPEREVAPRRHERLRPARGPGAGAAGRIRSAPGKAGRGRGPAEVAQRRHRDLTSSPAFTFAMVVRAGDRSSSMAGKWSPAAIAALCTLYAWAFLRAESQRAPPLLVLLAVGAVAALIGTLIVVPVMRTRGNYAALVTIAFALLFRTFLEVNDSLGGPQGLKLKEIRIGPWRFNDPVELGPFSGSFYLNYLALLLVLLAVAFVLVQRLERSWIGIDLDAVRLDETAAASFGIDVARWKTVAFTL